MSQLPILIKDKFFKFLNGSESIGEIEPWIYQTSILEDLLSKNDYLNLISLDFSKLGAKYKVNNILWQYIDLGEYETWKLKHLLLAFINEDGNPRLLLDDFYDLYCNRYYFLENLGLGYVMNGLESWSELITEEQSQQLDSFLQGARGEAQKVLSWLEANKIVIKTAPDEWDNFLFIDTRTYEEKKPTWHKIAAFSNRQKSKPWWKFWGKTA